MSDSIKHYSDGRVSVSGSSDGLKKMEKQAEESFKRVKKRQSEKQYGDMTFEEYREMRDAESEELLDTISCLMDKIRELEGDPNKKQFIIEGEPEALAAFKAWFMDGGGEYSFMTDAADYLWLEDEMITGVRVKYKGDKILLETVREEE